MARKNKYNTKQMQELYNYMKTRNGTHFTVKDICNYFESLDIQVSTTTIYRNLEKMISEGIVLKYNNVITNCAFFEFVDKTQNQEDKKCCHIVCEACGDIIHFNTKELSTLDNQIFEEFGFKINSPNTAFYGNCNNCMNS